MQFLVTSSRFSIIFVFFTTLFLAPLAHSAEYCMMLGGTKTSGPTQANVWTTDNCYGNLSKAFSAMRAYMAENPGQTTRLIIDDGNYTDYSSRINHTNLPPSGIGLSNMTVIKARNIPGQPTTDTTRYPSGLVPMNIPLRVRFTGDAKFLDQSGFWGYTDKAQLEADDAAGLIKKTRFIKFEGLHWDGVGLAGFWEYNYFKQCSSMGIRDGNNAAWTIAGQNNLLEDVVSYGKGRAKFLFYDVSREDQLRGDGNNLCRRCVARNDWAMKDDTGAEPITTFFSYYNRGTAFINAIDIDSNMPVYWSNLNVEVGDPINLCGSFTSFEVQSGVVHGMHVEGSLSINNAAGFGAASTTGNVFRDVAGIDIGGGWADKASGNIFDRMALVGIDTDKFDYRSHQHEQSVFGVTRNHAFMPNSGALPVVTNLLAKNIRGELFGNGTSGSHVFTEGIGTIGPITEAHITNIGDEQYKYPVRLENTSPLKSAGKNGADIGPRIMNRLGRDGTFKFQEGWNEDTGEPLWPWPMEAWVQAQLRTTDYEGFCATAVEPCPASHTTDAYRGFTEEGESLTNYIWGYMGHTPPPFNVKATGGSNLVHLTWDAPSDAYIDNITQFNVYDVTGQTDPVIPGVMSPTTTVVGNSTFSATIGSLTAGQNYQFAVTAVDSVTGESGYSYTVSAMPATVAISRNGI